MHNGPDSLIRIAVGRADIGVFFAACGCDERLYAVDFPLDGFSGAGVEILMIVCMVCQLVALVHNAAERFRPAGGVYAVDKEGGMDAALRQPVKKLPSVFTGAVVKGNCQQLCAAVLWLCRADRQSQRE